MQIMQVRKTAEFFKTRIFSTSIRYQSHQIVSKYLQWYPSLVSVEEECKLCIFLKDKFKTKKYQSNHWDNVISKYRETELHDGGFVSEILDKIKSKIREQYCIQEFLPPHAIDLAPDGHIGTSSFYPVCFAHFQYLCTL